MAENPPEPTTLGERMRVIVVEVDSNRRTSVTTAFAARGHTVTPVDSIGEAIQWIESGVVDLVISDVDFATQSDARLARTIHAQRTPLPLLLTTVNGQSVTSDLLRRVMADVLPFPFTEDALDDAIEKAQAHHALHGDSLRIQPFLTETIRFAIPSRVEYLDGILSHLSDRLIKLRVIEPDSIDVVVALDEAIVNAIKHGNTYDPSKRVTITCEITCDRARFEVTDEGKGFSEQDVPDPCAPENLLRTSGRGLLLIRNIMDEVHYNDSGNSIVMVKLADVRPAPVRPS